MPAKESFSNIRWSVAQVMRGCKKGSVEIKRDMKLTKEHFIADGIHPNLNGTSIIMQNILRHLPDCFISTHFVVSIVVLKWSMNANARYVAKTSMLQNVTN